MSDDLIREIDDAVADWEGSRDAMRWTPEPTEPRWVVVDYPDGWLPDDTGWPTRIPPRRWWHRFTRRSNA